MIYFGIFLRGEIEPPMSNLEEEYSADYCLLSDRFHQGGTLDSLVENNSLARRSVIGWNTMNSNNGQSCRLHNKLSTPTTAVVGCVTIL